MEPAGVDVGDRRSSARRHAEPVVLQRVVVGEADAKGALGDDDRVLLPLEVSQVLECLAQVVEVVVARQRVALAAWEIADRLG